MDTTFYSSIESKRNKLRDEADAFLKDKGISDGAWLFNFSNEDEDFNNDLNKFKILFNNGYLDLLWNQFVLAIDISKLNEEDFSDDEWAFLENIAKEKDYNIYGKENINKEIETERLILTLPSDERREAFEKFFEVNQEEFFEYTGFEYQSGASWGLLSYKISHLFYLMEKDTKEIVGYVALKRTCDFFGAFNLEYFIFPEYRKKGYATEALRVLIKKAFSGELIEEMESIRKNVLERKPSVFDIIYIRTKSTNTASKLLAEKLGFTFDGTNKKGFVFPDRELCFDELIYSLENLPSEESWEL